MACCIRSWRERALYGCVARLDTVKRKMKKWPRPIAIFGMECFLLARVKVELGLESESIFSGRSWSRLKFVDSTVLSPADRNEKGVLVTSSPLFLRPLGVLLLVIACWRTLFRDVMA